MKSKGKQYSAFQGFIFPGFSRRGWSNFVCVLLSLLVLGGMWDVIVLVPDHCLSIYFPFPIDSRYLVCANSTDLHKPLFFSQPVDLGMTISLDNFCILQT